ncbi:hypothetical protein Agub_g11664 [Astrephomene gubernaculifera]|uniref:Uncharacterized protein n=1 Tax=Astrephomene gubernaculifera TaxID=47775 RepID=A0AAD3HR58_9CHLO|nr:hypothetical protein Agub_g11664 [Astrephomene gubernaculifera]
MQHLCLRIPMHHSLSSNSSFIRKPTLPTFRRRLDPRHGVASDQLRIQRRKTRCYAMNNLGQIEPHPVRRAFLSIGVPEDDLHRASCLEPALLEYTTERLYAMLDLLLNLGLTGSDIGKVLIAFPQAFQLSTDHHAAPAVDFLRTDVGLGPAEVRAVVTRFPAVLGMNVKAQLRPQVAYLTSLGVPPESLRALVLSRPLVLGPGIESVISFLRRCGLPRTQMHRLLRSYPLDYRVHVKGFSAAASGGSSPPGGGSGGGMGRGRAQ